MQHVKKIISRIVMFLFVIGIALSSSAGNVYADSSSADSMSTTENENRLSGNDRIETSLKISQNGWKYGAATAVIAQGYGYADALCAAPLAKKYNAPIILSRQDSLSDETVSELKRLKVDKVFVIGGTSSLSDNVESQLKNIGVSNVKRLGGADRYETSVKIAEELGNVDNIVVTSGNGYADSLSIASIAAKKGMPILLSQSNELPQIVKNYLKNRDIAKTYIVGGTAVIPGSLESSLPNAVRLGGTTRFDTNLAVLQNFKADLNFDNVYIASGDGPNGDEFADALSGSALASTKSAPMVLVYNTLSTKTADFLKSNMSGKTVLTALGGTLVVPAVIVDDLVHYFNGEATSGGIGDETKPGTGSGGVVVNPSAGNTFTIVISKDNGTILKQKVFDIDSSKNALDYLNTMASVSESSDGFITSIDGNSSIPVSGLSDSDRKSGYYGIDWFIYLDGQRTGVGIKGVNVKPGSTLNLDYHKYDWHDLVDPGTTAVPLSLSVPDSIQTGKSITVKFTCAGKPVYGGTISIDGKSAVATDENGNADITITTSGSHDIKAEKESGQDKGSVTKTVNISSSGGGGGGSSAINVTGVTLNTSAVTMAQGNILRLIPNVKPDDASNKNVTWSSSDEKIATVDSNGVVNAVQQGSAVITVTTQNNGKTAGCAVTVTDEKAKDYSDYESYINSLVDGITSNISVDAWTAMELNKLGKTVPNDYLSDLEQQIKDTPDKLLKQPTDCAKTVIGIVAAGGDPTNFEGQNLIKKLYSYSNQSMLDQGISAYVFSLMALDSANFSVPDGIRQNLVDKILSYKTNDGGWTYYGDTADPDMTSMAISALTPYKYRTDVNSAVNGALDKLSSMQSEDGGFASWEIENPNSVEMVIIALCDSGIDPAKDAAFIKNGKNPIDALMSFKADDNSGFYGVDESGNVIKSVNSSATEQGLRALAAYKLFNQGKGSVYKNFVDYNTDINNLVNGIISKISSSPDDWTVMELNKLGQPIPYDYLTDLQQKIESTSEEEYFKYFTTYARTVIGIVAAGGDPTNFAGQNLVEKIYNGEQSMQGVNDYVYSLIALDSANFSVPDGIRQNLVNKILSYKIGGGGWTYSGDTADPDMTSMAISALAPYKDSNDINNSPEVKSAVDAAVDKLSSMQSEDGGYASYGTENPNSVEMVIIGLCDNGIDPASDARFIKSGGNPISALLKFAVSDNTGFWSPWNTDKTVDSSATEQGLRALTAYKLFKDGKGSVYKNFIDVDTTDIPVDSITLDKTEATLKEEETLKLTPVLSPENATDKKINWTSDNTDVAIVDEYGNVIAVGAGQTNITATTENGNKSASCSITVEKGQAINVSLNVMGYNGNILNEDIKTEDGEVKDGETVYRLLTTMFYKNHISYEIYNDPSWGHYVNMIDGQESNDRGQYSGWSYNINGESAQGGIDSYELKDGDKIDMFFTADFTNPFRDIDSVTLDKSNLDLNAEDTEKLTAAVTPDNTTEALVWTSNNPDVAAVDEYGNVTAVSEGTATITVKPQYNTHAETVSCVVNVK